MGTSARDEYRAGRAISIKEKGNGNSDNILRIRNSFGWISDYGGVQPKPCTLRIVSDLGIF